MTANGIPTDETAIFLNECYSMFFLLIMTNAYFINARIKITSDKSNTINEIFTQLKMN